MREFLVISPFNIVFCTFIVIIMRCCRLVLKCLLPSDLDIQKLPCGLSPSMIMLEEHVVQLWVASEAGSPLIHVRWNVANFVDNSWSNLGDVHINQEAVVGVDLKKLVLGKVFGVNILLDIAYLMGQDDVRVSGVVSWSLEIVDFQVL